MAEALDIARLFPPGVAAAEFTPHLLGDASLHLDEEAALGSVSPKRRTDFTLGRAAAREALRRLGVEPDAILPGEQRQPLWPVGVCGSITHCESYGAAVVAFKTQLRGLGIDAEVSQRLSDGVFSHIALDDERGWLRTADPLIPWRILLFSSKESVFKAWFPIAETWLDFKHVRIDFNPTAGEFAATILPHAPGVRSGMPTRIEGRFTFTCRLVITAAFIPAEPR